MASIYLNHDSEGTITKVSQGSMCVPKGTYITVESLPVPIDELFANYGVVDGALIKKEDVP